MELSTIPIAAKVILGIIVVLGILFAIIKGPEYYCFKHWDFKRIKALDSEDNTKFCEQCIADAMNPSLECPCGWKGKLKACDCYEGETQLFFCCPACHKPFDV